MPRDIIELGPVFSSAGVKRNTWVKLHWLRTRQPEGDRGSYWRYIYYASMWFHVWPIYVRISSDFPDLVLILLSCFILVFLNKWTALRQCFPSNLYALCIKNLPSSWSTGRILDPHLYGLLVMFRSCKCLVTWNLCVYNWIHVHLELY